MVKKLWQLTNLSLGECLLLVQLVAFSLVMGVGLRCVALPCLVGFLTQCTENDLLRRFPLLHGWYEVARLATLADMAARVTHGQGRCLIRSLLLFWLLKGQRESVELLIGVSKGVATLQAHAWIETQGKVIGDTSEPTGRFVPLLRF